jgi:hypothetical protein
MIALAASAMKDVHLQGDHETMAQLIRTSLHGLSAATALLCKGIHDQLESPTPG